MHTLARLVLPAALLACAAAAGAQSLGTRTIVSGLDQPLFLTSAPGDSALFVVQKGGSVLRVQGSVGSFFSVPVATAGEQGLLGLAFDPAFAQAGSAGYRRFFVDYIDAATGDTVVASYRTNASGTQADPATRSEVLRIDQPNGLNNHKAGWIGFKPGDGDHLFIATGDGGGGNDPFNNGQNRGTLLGKVLRVDVNRDDFADPNVNYGIPADNPFATQAGVRGEIFAYGLRNPWRASFDRATGDLWIGDVGQGAREEVDFIAAASPGGQNFGWRVREGDIATPGVGGPLQPGMVDPVYTYGRDRGVAITGGYVVRDAASPLDGRYVFADLSGRFYVLDPASGGVTEVTAQLDPAGALNTVASFGEGPDGALYIVDLGGSVVQVVPEPATWLLWAGGVAALAWRRRASHVRGGVPGAGRRRIAGDADAGACR